MKKLFVILFALALMSVACENQNKENAANAAAEKVEMAEAVPVDLDDFEAQAENLVGKEIKFYGLIDHVCKHGGQKMFLVSPDSDARVKVVTGADMAAFNTELEGETVEVVGIVEELRIDEEYLKEWEEELKSGEGEEMAEQVHMGEGEGEAEHDHEAETDISAEMENINNLRQQVAESGKGYVSFFSVVCVNYKTVDTEQVEAL